MPINLKTLYAVTALIINDSNEVLLLKRSEISYHGYWQFPEGKIDKGETKLQAIKRELAEEIGATNLKISKLKKHRGDFLFKGSPVKLERQVYMASIPKKIILSSEHSEFGWFSKKEVQALKLVPGVREIINTSM